MAGGYAEDIDDTVAIHFATVRAASQHWSGATQGCLAVALDPRY
jgi:hypothetical protein